MLILLEMEYYKGHIFRYLLLCVSLVMKSLILKNLIFKKH